MSNDFYNETGNPSTSSAGASALMRAEFALVRAAFDKFPTLTGNGLKVVRVNTGGTALEAVDASTLMSGVSGFSGTVSPSQITSNQNNYNPTGWSSATVMRLSTDASRNITGIYGGSAGRLAVLHNIGSFNFVLKDSDASSDAENRFALDADLTVRPDWTAVLQYDSTSQRWRLWGMQASAFIQTLLDDTTASAARSTLGATGYSDTRAFGGRLTLASGTPVMTTDQTAKTTVYFTPYNGDVIPIYDGTDMVPTTFTELSQATTDTTKSPAAVAANKNYDVFVWNDGGTIRATRGPAWSSDTSRGTGAGTSELVMVAGVYLNANAITNGPAASRGTYVGTIRSNGSSQIDWKLGSAAAGGGEAFLGVWNMYNRVSVMPAVQDTTDSWTYQSTTIRSMNNSATNRISFVRGLDEDGVWAQNSIGTSSSGSGDLGIASIGLDSTTANAANSAATQSSAAGAANTFAFLYPSYAGLPGIGIHYLQCLERCVGVVAVVTFFGDEGAPTVARQQFTAKLRA